MGEAPGSGALKIAFDIRFERGKRFDAGRMRVKADLVGEPAFPGVSAHAADAAVFSFIKLLHMFRAFPPMRPVQRLGHRIVYLMQWRFYTPEGDQPVLSHDAWNERQSHTRLFISQFYSICLTRIMLSSGTAVKAGLRSGNEVSTAYVSAAVQRITGGTTGTTRTWSSVTSMLSSLLTGSSPMRPGRNLTVVKASLIKRLACFESVSSSISA
jgi:hypothetical protein